MRRGPEADLETAAARRVKALLAGWQARGDMIQVPALWYYEITSVLSKGVYFKEFNRVKPKKCSF